ncbi:MAG: hypothetical protein IJX57_01760, partial [Clostridia bacterium]|nr:hypothetical protein [Clostridia bacterium]
VGTVKTLGELGSVLAPFGVVAATSAGLATAVSAPFIAVAGAAVLASKAVENYHEELINSGGDALKTAEEYSATVKAAYDMSEQVKTVGEYTDRYRELKELLASGNQTDKSEKERKNIEQWFIDNYGEYISAVEQKKWHTSRNTCLYKSDY